MLADLLFWICALATVGGALASALLPNLVHAALCLGLALSGVAGLYLFLEAYYLACVQVIVYVGGILILILFATLFSSDILGRFQRSPPWQRVGGLCVAAIAGALAVRLGQVVYQHAATLEHQRPAQLREAIAAPGGIGDLLTGPWLIPFLLASLLLTAALLAAVALVQRYRHRTPKDADGS
ncbi:MAG: NADH-quinone oxidoreductase subunit J [Planctomycetota bacterium]|nr:NADH-quinone oxidoreductase subunit J [Planctomycetota bacterium]